MRSIVKESCGLSAAERRQLLALFETNYRQASAAYLEKSLGRLRYVGMALQAGTLVGFALGESRVIDLPGLPAQVVGLAGLACVADELRRHGLFTELARRAMSEGGSPDSGRRLVCGRVAHPAALRTITQFPTAVPRPGVHPSPWQQSVGEKIAEAYGVCAFDPATFVCLGDGIPIGYPRIQLDLEPREWELFRTVNRDRGDSLLAMAWVPEAPPDW